MYRIAETRLELKSSRTIQRRILRGSGAASLGVEKRDETAKIKIRKTNLECHMESTKSKIGVRKEAHKPEFRSSMPGLKPFIANRLPVVKLQLRRGKPAVYHIASTRLIFQDVEDARLG